MTAVAIIQARMGSSRLPGKVLQDLGGLPAIAWPVRAARAVTGFDGVAVATTDQDQDDAIVAWCRANDVPCHRGPEDDVLARYLLAARAEKADIIMRLTADCPLLDPKVMDEVLMVLQLSGVEYASNIEPRTWPDGLDCEVFTREALEAAAAEAKRTDEREHVTLFIRRFRDRFSTRNVTCPIPGLKSEEWTLDNPEDLEFLRAVVARLSDPTRPPSYMEVLRILDADPDLRSINRGAKRTLELAPVEDVQANHFERTQALLERAERVIPLGSQTFSKSRIQYPDGQAPLFLTHGDGGRVWDVDGNMYVDMVSGLLPVVLGYRDEDVDRAVREQLDSGISFSLSTRLEADLAERLVEIIPCAEMVRFGKNGTDATSAAIRLARAFTGRDHVAVCGYHGWQDWYIGTTSRDKGVPEGVKGLSHTFPYNDAAALDSLLRQDEFAAVIMEPMSASEPAPGYLDEVKKITHRHGALLIFDEIITGFRFAMGGAQELFGVTPDLAAFGKAMGNGMPISAVVGRTDVLKEMENVFFSGTFGGEALSIAAAIAVIDKMRREPVIETMWKTGQCLSDGLKAHLRYHGLDGVITLAGKPPWVILIYNDHPTASKEAIKTFVIRQMLRGGVLLLHSHNVCYAHDPSDVAHVLGVYDRTLAELADVLEKGTLEQDLGVPVITPVFTVR